MDPDSSSDDDVNAGMAQLRLSGEKLLELPDELLAIIGAFAPTGGLVRSSRRCLKVTESACERLARERFPEWVIRRGVVSCGAAEPPAAVTNAVRVADRVFYLEAKRERAKKKRAQSLFPGLPFRETLFLEENMQKPIRGVNKSVERARELLAGVCYTYQSWRALIADDARKIGLWCLDVRGVSRPTRNLPSGGYEGRILRLALDDFSGELTAIVEAYGEADLREAHTSALVLEDGTKAGAYRTFRTEIARPTSGLDQRLRASYIVRSATHHICRMDFPMAFHNRMDTLSFQYGAFMGATLNNGHGEQLANMGPAPFQDYQISQFLRKDPEQTWEAAFRGPGPLPEGASRRRFVPRPLAFPKAERTPRADWIREAA